MLRINPNEVIRYTKLIDLSLDNIENNISSIQSTFDTLNATTKQKITNIQKMQQIVTRLRDKLQYLNKIVFELEEITGLSKDKLADLKYSNTFYEKKILEYYTEKLQDSKTSKSDYYKALNKLDFYYDVSNDNGQLNNYYQRYSFKKNLPTLLKNFDYQQFGLRKEEVLEEIMFIYDQRGSNEAYNVTHALVNNCPPNYFDYHFNPTNQLNSNSHYDFNNKTINQYQTNSEIININGYNYEFNQVLPKDCTNVEKLVYDFSKANIINTMRTLPDNYLKLCSMGNSNSIILTCTKEVMNNTGNWGGYYKTSSLLNKNTNMIAIDVGRSLEYSDYYTQDILIHELSHKYDDMLKDKNIIDYLFGSNYYSTNNNEWQEMFKKNQSVIKNLTHYEYKDFPNINEFFGDTAVAYFKKPIELKNNCPEIYNLFSKTIGNEYGYSYQEKINEIFNT